MLIAILSIMFGVLLGTGLTMLGVLFALRFIQGKGVTAAKLVTEESPMVS